MASKIFNPEEIRKRHQKSEVAKSTDEVLRREEK
jgi:hypothetical protein